MGIFSDKEINAFNKTLKKVVKNASIRTECLKYFERGVNSAKTMKSEMFMGTNVTVSIKLIHAFNGMMSFAYGKYESAQNFAFELGQIVGILKYQLRALLQDEKEFKSLLYRLGQALELLQQHKQPFYDFLIEQFKIWQTAISSQSLLPEEAKLYEEIIKVIS